MTTPGAIVVSARVRKDRPPVDGSIRWPCCQCAHRVWLDLHSQSLLLRYDTQVWCRDCASADPVAGPRMRAAQTSRRLEGPS